VDIHSACALCLPSDGLLLPVHSRRMDIHSASRCVCPRRGCTYPFTYGRGPPLPSFTAGVSVHGACALQTETSPSMEMDGWRWLGKSAGHPQRFALWMPSEGLLLPVHSRQGPSTAFVHYGSFRLRRLCAVNGNGLLRCGWMGSGERSK